VYLKNDDLVDIVDIDIVDYIVVDLAAVINIVFIIIEYLLYY